MTLQQDLSGFEAGRFLEFLQLDLTEISDGSETYFRVFNSWNNSDVDGQINFLGVTWDPLPFTSEGFSWDGGGGTPRPTITVSDFDGLLMVAALNYGYLIGAKVTRWETTTAHRASGDSLPPEEWIVNKLVEFNGMTMKIELAAPTDVKSRKIPGIRMTRARFPALARNRMG